MNAVVAIDPVRDEDLHAIVALERETQSNPWSIEHFAEIIDLPGGLGIVARPTADKIAGFVVGWAVTDEAEIANIAVAERCRRLGIGSRLVAAFLAAVRKSGARRAYLEVRSSNHVARNFYRCLGFDDVGTRPGYYSRPAEDAVVMAVDLVDDGG